MRANNLFNLNKVQNMDCLESDYKSLEVAIKAISKLQNEILTLKHKIELSNNTIAIKDGKDLHLIKLENIIYLEAKSNYCSIYLREKKTLFTSKTLKYWEEKIPTSVFIRCHKSYIFNINEVEKLIPAENSILMSNGSQIKVSRDMSKNVKQKLNEPHLSILHPYKFKV